MRTPGDDRATGPLLATIVLLTACTLPPLETATPWPSPSPSTTPSPTATPTEPTPGPSLEPTPDPAAIPDFAAGEIVASLIDGLRVRQRPGVDAQIATGLLPLNAELEVIMGPLPVDDFGWYLVRDVDPADPQFTEGWVAAGYEPDPFLRATGRSVPDGPYVVAMAGTGDAEEGPIEIGEGDHAIRWIARDVEGVRCTFTVMLAAPGGDPVRTIQATVGSGVDRGTLQPQTFASLGVRGTAFMSVASDCAWALVMLRVPELDPAASPTATP